MTKLTEFLETAYHNIAHVKRLYVEDELTNVEYQKMIGRVFYAERGKILQYEDDPTLQIRMAESLTWLRQITNATPPYN